MGIAAFKQFYAGKKIFLTGHTGFKGSWLLAWLKNLNCVVKGYSLAPENENSLYNVLNGDAICKTVSREIRNRGKLKGDSFLNRKKTKKNFKTLKSI